MDTVLVDCQYLKLWLPFLKQSKKIFISVLFDWKIVFVKISHPALFLGNLRINRLTIQSQETRNDISQMFIDDLADLNHDGEFEKTALGKSNCWT